MRLHPLTPGLPYSGLQGLQRLHANTAPSTKRSKKAPLGHNDMDLKHVISSERVLVKNVIHHVKVLRTMGERCRTRGE